ncbi:MAG: terpene cyclase/mutase family protein, partial [Planctomycetes bacterium]|nr:terpene cyclase/mutase family protein [Planctomycetota bacterium]
ATGSRERREAAMGKLDRVVVLGGLFVAAWLAGGPAARAQEPSGPPAARSPDETAGLATGTRGVFAGRRGAKTGLRRWYGGEGTTPAVELGLEWLARHQVPDAGYWDSDGFAAQCRGAACDGKGIPLYDPGLTGLAILAFLGSGHTHQAGPYKKTVGEAIKHLRRIQDPEGCFGLRTGHFMYSHAIATLAFVEAYAMTDSPILRPAVEKALAFLCQAQNPDPSGTRKLGWRYTVRPGDNDTSVTGWAVLALKTAQWAGLEVAESSLEGGRGWLDRMTDPATGRCGYVERGVSPVRAPGREEKWPRSRSEAITALAMLCRVFLGEDPARSEPIRQGAELCLARLPRWSEEDGSIDMYYWYHGTAAMFQLGGPSWAKWNEAMKKAIVEHQRKDGCAEGSWDPVGPWGADGGRVYATAMMTLSLEAYYRHARLFASPEEAAGPEAAARILLRLAASPGGCACSINGESVGLLPDCATKVYEKLLALEPDPEQGWMEIDAEPAVSFQHVITIWDACVRVRRARATAEGKVRLSGIRLPFPERGIEVRIDLVVADPAVEHGHVRVDLPQSRVCNRGTGVKPWLTVSIPWDAGTGASRFAVKRSELSLEELKAWIYPIARSKVDPKTKFSEIPILIRCDRRAPFRAVREVLAICADRDILIHRVFLAVVETKL